MDKLDEYFMNELLFSHFENGTFDLLGHQSPLSAITK